MTAADYLELAGPLVTAIGLIVLGRWIRDEAVRGTLDGLTASLRGVKEADGRITAALQEFARSSAANASATQTKHDELVKSGRQSAEDAQRQITTEVSRIGPKVDDAIRRTEDARVASLAELQEYGLRAIVVAAEHQIASKEALVAARAAQADAKAAREETERLGTLLRALAARLGANASPPRPTETRGLPPEVAASGADS